MINIGVLISGGGTNLQALINEIEAQKIDAQIKLVVSNRKDAYGLVRAKAHGINCVVLDKEEYKDKKTWALHRLLKDNDIDLVILAGYLDILSEEIILDFENRILNIHPSLIPSFCGKGFYGKRVHREAIKRGVKISGATVHFVNEVTDGGPIILQETVTVEDWDDEDTLQEKVLVLEHKLLPRAVKLFCEGRLKVVNQKVKIL